MLYVTGRRAVEEAKIMPKRPMLAQISVCQGCCCGKTEKGRPAVPVDWLKREWKVRGLLKRVHLTITGCLGPCDIPNVVSISSSEGTLWLALLDSQNHYDMLAGWAETSKDADRLLPLPEALRVHAFNPYRPQEAMSFDKKSRDHKTEEPNP